MAATVTPRSPLVRKVSRRPGAAAVLSLGALLLVVLAALLASGALSPGDLVDGASYWRWDVLPRA
jgi:hypothetical protein